MFEKNKELEQLKNQYHELIDSLKKKHKELDKVLKECYVLKAKMEKINDDK